MSASELVNELWCSVQENLRKLDACEGPHDLFDQSPKKKFAKVWQCTKCGGNISGTNAIWYKKGLAHGRAEVQDEVKK